MIKLTLVFLGVLSSLSLSAQTHTAKTPQRTPQAPRIHVTLAQGLPDQNSGRLIVFVTAKKVEGQEMGPDFLDPHSVWMEAQEVHDLKPGQSVDIDPQAPAYPDSFSRLPTGDYSARRCWT